jgi:hypothetical protein
MMIAEITAAVQSLRVLGDLIQANHTFRNFNELVTAVYEVNAKLLAVQSVALESQEKQATFTQRIGELEKEIVKLKDWNREAERYQLTEVARGVFTYLLKPGMEQSEPAHMLCTNCFTQKEKSVLQADSPGRKSTTHRCPRCKNILAVPHATRPLEEEDEPDVVPGVDEYE